MPGMPVYQDSPSSLKNQIYATDGSNVINVKADDTGRLTISTDAAAPLDVSINEANDSILVYGNDGADNQIIKTNSSGQLDIRPLTSADTVSVIIDEANDSILVYGNDGANNQALKTDDQGVLQVNYTRAFVDETIVNAQATANTYAFSGEQDISNMASYAFFVNNTGITNSATFKVQLSPDNITWVDDGDELAVVAETANIMTANRFLKYIRIGYKSTTADDSTTVTVIFQAQS